MQSPLRGANQGLKGGCATAKLESVTGYVIGENMLELYQQTGKMALGSRLRQLSEALAAQAARVYPLYHVEIDPKWFPVFFMLRSGNSLSISVLADAIGHSHASVSKIVKEMTAAGLIANEKTPADGRINQVRLSDKAKQFVPNLQRQCDDAEAVVEELLQQSQHKLWEAISEVEYLLNEEDFYSRMKNKYSAGERHKIDLVEYRNSHREAFRDLNYDWIERHFTVEESDRAQLEAPREYILDKGGYIVMALYEGQAVGTCALIRHGNGSWELAKMAVSDVAKGKGIGYLLGMDIISKAREFGANKLFLESNTTLSPAINLYKKLGFKRIVGEPSPYARCNIQMEQEL